MNQFKAIAYYLLFLSIVVGLTFEIGFRIKGTYKTYHEQMGKHYQSLYVSHDNPFLTLVPNRTFIMERPEFQVEYRNNSIGYREREYASAEGSEPNVYVFGDSFVEGMGVEYPDTWPRHLENLLRMDYPGASVNVAASSSSDPFYSLNILENRILNNSGLHPSHVIFSVNPTDLDDYLVRGGSERFREPGKVLYRKPPKSEILFRFSHLFRFVMVEFYGYDLHMVRPVEAASDFPEACRAIAQCLQEAAELCEQRGIGFLAVIHPIPGDICFKGAQADAVHDIMRATITGIPMVDLTGAFGAMTGDDCIDYFWPEDGHFNAKGYRLFGNILYQSIGEQHPGFWQAGGPDSPMSSGYEISD